MKFLRFFANNKEKFGYLEGNKIVELKENFLINPTDRTGNQFSLEEVKLLAPVKPGKVVAIGLNYVKHAEEVNKPLPEEPMIFMVSNTAIIGPDEEIRLHDQEHETHFEAELVVVIGKEAKGVKQEDALEYVFGYTCGNDISDRYLQRRDVQYTRAKSFDTYKPLGPVIETELNPNQLDITLRQNGVVKQQANTNDFVFGVEELIEAITSVMTLYPGDVIYTGTPSGVGPIQPGDKLEIEIEGIGVLSNHVV